MRNINILLETDYAIKKMFELYPKLKDNELQEKWNPWKTYITISLWNCLERLDKDDINGKEA